MTKISLNLGEVETGVQNDFKTEIKSGLNEGEKSHCVASREWRTSWLYASWSKNVLKVR